MDIMGKTVSKIKRSRPVSWIRLILVIASVFSLLLSIDWYYPASAADPLLHNSTNLGSSRWSSDGGWGIAGGKYGEFVCETCHVRLATNIKSIRSTITTPDVTKGALPGAGQPILFDRTSGIPGDPGTMGDDSNTPRTSSNKICEICHTYSTGQNGVNVHAYNSQGNNLGNHMEANAADCTVCHQHNVGFKAVACDTCHGLPPTDVLTLAKYKGMTTGSTTAGKHVAHTSAPLSFSCDNCHKGYVMPQESTTVKPGFWDISINFSNFGSTSGTYSGQSGLSYNQTAGTGGLACSTVYCHGGRDSLLDGTNKTPSWTGSVACGDCHKATGANPPTLGNHARHAGNNTAAGQLNLACTDCHGANGAGGKGHVDARVQWALNSSLNKIGPDAKYNGAASGTIDNLAPSTSYQSCSSIYCHSDVQGTGGSGGPTSYKTPTWGGGTLGCGSCHTDMSGATGTGNHVKHANVYSFACSICHNNAGANTAAHANYTVDLNFSGQASLQTTPIYSQDGTPGNLYGSCSTVYCHSNVQAPGGNAPATTYGNPTWGDTATISCGGCHTDMSTTTDLTLGTHQRHTNSAENGVQYQCSMCHGTGYSPTTVVTATHANGMIDTSFTGQAAGTIYSQAGINTPGSGGYGTCSVSACHGRATKNWGTSSNLVVCEKCHGSKDSIAVDNGFRDTSGNIGSAYAGTHKSHLLAIHDYSDPITCEQCHIKPAAVNSVGHMNGMPATITWGPLSTGSIRDGSPSNSPIYSGEAGGRTCSNTYCHNRGGSPLKQTPYWGDLGYGLVCGNCHSNPPAYPHPQGANCSGCHYHVATSNTGFKATYRLIEGICSNRLYTDQTNCETNGGTWTPPGINVPGKSLHVDGRVQFTKDECLGCHSTSGDFALIGQHYLHTDNDYFLSRSVLTGTATGGSTTTVVDATQSWTTDQYKDAYVRVKDVQLKIAGNTANTLTVTTAFTNPVAAADGYDIRTAKLLSNDDYDDPGWIYQIYYENGFPRYACGFCHPSDSSNHRNGIVNLDMNPIDSLPGTVKTKNDPNGPWFNQTVTGSDVTCIAVYCHSNGYMSPTTNTYQYKTTPNWYATDPWAGLDRCAQCHGNSPNTGGNAGSAAHAKHSVGIHYNDTFSGTSGKMTNAHGDGNSTTINCNVCHDSTVKVAYNDKNPICNACHNSSLKGDMIVDPANVTHINGSVDVTFSTPLNLKTKAQLRDNIATVSTVDESWTRSNGYKRLTPSVSHDQSKTTPVYSAGTCTNTACHNATPMQWGQAGPLQCMVCHLGLPK